MYGKQTVRSAHQYRQRGLTLVETMATLAVAAILLTAAVPPMQDFIVRNRMSTEVNTFIASTYLARSEAVKRMQSVSLCPTSNFTSCASGSDWNIGWMIYTNNDGAAGFDADAGDVILQRNPPLPLHFKIIGSHNFITYSPVGGANAGSYVFCDNGGVATRRKVVIWDTGRVYVNQQSSTGCP